jgi:hypothetical protein
MNLQIMIQQGVASYAPELTLQTLRSNVHHVAATPPKNKKYVPNRNNF